MQFYFATILLFVIIYNMLGQFGISNRKTNKYGVFVLPIFTIIFVILTYILEVYIYCDSYALVGRVLRREIVYLLLMVILSFIVYRYVYNLRVKSPRKLLRNIAGVVISLISSIIMFAPNIFKNGHWGILHIHAYTNTIVNVAKLIPYSDINNSIYGHYGIIYLPFVKLFGDNTFAIMFTISFFVFIIIFLATRLCNKIIKNDVVYLLAIIAIFSITTTYYLDGVYIQLLPHRYLHLMIALYLTIVVPKYTGRKVLKFLHLVFLTISFIWSLEVGLICSLIYFSYELMVETKDFKKFLLIIVSQIVFICSSFILAYAIVNIYNVLCNGEILTMKSYIYPFLSSDFNLKMLTTYMILPISEFFIYFVVFLTALCINFSISIKNRRISFKVFNSEIVLIIIAGLSYFVYFINREAYYCLPIVKIYYYIVISYLIDRFVFEKKNLNINKSFFNILLFLLVFECVQGVISTPKTIHSRVDTLWNYKSLEEDFDKFSKINNDNTLFIGMGMPELCYSSNVENNLGCTDFSDEDFHNKAKEYVLLESKKYNKLFVTAGSERTRNVKPILEEFNLTETISFNNFEINVYTRN